jgi:hypothetical protein
VWVQRSTGEIAVLLGHSLSPPFDTRSTLDLLACDVCGDLHSLMDLAIRRVTRKLTSTERERYLDAG